VSRLFRTKSIESLIEASERPEGQLRKSLGPLSLTALGVGAVIGSGIFTLTGTAAAGKVEKIESVFHATILDLLTQGAHAGSMMGREGAGPAVSISFLLVAIACVFAGLCYAELASMIPVAGSAYTYSYAILGEIFAWIIGWDLILEYAVSNMSVAVGFSAYLQDLGDNLVGYHLPSAIAYPAFAASGQPSGVFNIPALLITMLVTWVLVRGVRESAGANTAMVVVKMVAIVLFCAGAANAIKVEDRNHRNTDCLHDPLRQRGAGFDWNCQVSDAQHGFASCGCLKGSGLQPAARGGDIRGADGHDVLLVGIPVRTGARLVCHVA